MTNDRAYSDIAVSVLVSCVGKLISPIQFFPFPRKIALLASNVRVIVTGAPNDLALTPVPHAVAVTVDPHALDAPLIAPEVLVAGGTTPYESVIVIVSWEPQVPPDTVTDGDPTDRI